jgi:hypothetical protein
VVDVDDAGGLGERGGGEVPDPGGSVAEDGQLADVVRAAADALGLHQALEPGGGLEGGDVAGRGPVPDRVPVVVELVLGEEDGHLGLAGAGAAVLALAFPACGLPGCHGDACAVDDDVELVRQRGQRQRDELAAGDEAGPLARRGGQGGTVGLGCPLGALDGQADPGQVVQQAGCLRERHRGGGFVAHGPQSRRHRGCGHPELGVPGGEPVPAAGAVIPGPSQGDGPEHRVDDLLPVAGEHGLVAAAAVHARSPVARIGGQRLPEDAAAELQQPGPEHRLGCLQAVPAAQRPGGLGRQAS